MKYAILTSSTNNIQYISAELRYCPQSHHTTSHHVTLSARSNLNYKRRPPCLNSITELLRHPLRPHIHAAAVGSNRGPKIDFNLTCNHLHRTVSCKISPLGNRRSDKSDSKGLYLHHRHGSQSTLSTLYLRSPHNSGSTCYVPVSTFTTTRYMEALEISSTYSCRDRYSYHPISYHQRPQHRSRYFPATSPCTSHGVL